MPFNRKRIAQEVCADLGISRPTLTRWCKVGCPHDRDGRLYLFDLEEVRQWMHAVGYGEGHGGDSSEPPLTPEEGQAAARAIQEDTPTLDPLSVENLEEADLRELRHRHLVAKVRKDVADAMRKELDLQVRRGELLDREEVEQGRLDRVSYARAVLLGGPARLAPDLVGLDVEGIEAQLSEWIDEALRELAS